ncbi:TetR/AcrR family transcriptional regulator [Actinomadura sp. 9N407]|uniref:TetR/AcrR family transcriptional regulator n=1 Tax=Actinomadura sp. 9N407 TaxID=3375154 RepID=UPI00378838A2
MSDETPRERYRRQIRQEALSAALDQLIERGAAALSVNAVAKHLGLSGPALYRYFSGRDELLTELLVDAYAELADVLEAAAHRDGSAAARLRALAEAYREWALAHAQRYLLIFGTPVPGYDAPTERTTPHAQRALGVIMAVHASEPPRRAVRTNAAADAACADWAARAGAPSLDGSLVRSAITFWTRLHGIVSLEIEGHFAATLPEAALIYAAEVDELVAPWE